MLTLNPYASHPGTPKKLAQLWAKHAELSQAASKKQYLAWVNTWNILKTQDPKSMVNPSFKMKSRTFLRYTEAVETIRSPQEPKAPTRTNRKTSSGCRSENCICTSQKTRIKIGIIRHFSLIWVICMVHAKLLGKDICVGVFNVL